MNRNLLFSASILFLFSFLLACESGTTQDDSSLAYPDSNVVHEGPANVAFPLTKSSMDTGRVETDSNKQIKIDSQPTVTNREEKTGRSRRK